MFLWVVDIISPISYKTERKDIISATNYKAILVSEIDIEKNSRFDSMKVKAVKSFLSKYMAYASKQNHSKKI